MKTARGETVGVIQAINKRDDTFTTSDEDLIAVFSNQLGMYCCLLLYIYSLLLYALYFK